MRAYNSRISSRDEGIFLFLTTTPRCRLKTSQTVKSSVCLMFVSEVLLLQEGNG
jgi:hypothetical protein